MLSDVLIHWAAQGKHTLWPEEPLPTPQTEGSSPPTLRAHLPHPSQANGAAIIVFPGGGYSMLAPHEADPVAQWLTTLGLVGFVLDYRLAPHFKHPAMLEDAARGVRTVRAHANKWGIDPNRIGVLGFSAGGHLVTTLATHFDEGNPNHPDPIERVSSRPDLVIPIYPVVSFIESYAHAWCRQCLLGENPSFAQLEDLSAERRVTPNTPPMFLVHSIDDESVPPHHSLNLAIALSEAKVPYELHIYGGGGHGYGLGAQTPFAHAWPQECARWLKERGFLNGLAEDGA